MKKKTIDFYIASLEHGAFDGTKDTKGSGKTTKISVEMTTIDYEWAQPGYANISFIKTDVEGAKQV